MVDYLTSRINSALGFDSGDPDALEALVDKNPEMLDFADNHLSSLVFILDSEDEED